MQLHQLKYFVAVVKTGSITKAAEQCFISQPSISQQLAKLEESIGRKLFSRVKGKLILTDPGHIFYEQACNILKTWRMQNVESAILTAAAVVREYQGFCQRWRLSYCRRL